VSQDIRYYSAERKERAVAWLFSIIGLLMMVGPAWALTYIPSNAGRLGLSTFFAILFFGLVGIASNAKPQEVLAAAAT
jgi:1,4-dihydroxy-2-naphthoate octaprenyltransferase